VARYHELVGQVSTDYLVHQVYRAMRRTADLDRYPSGGGDERYAGRASVVPK
jgi:hypothetical protein